MSSNNDENMKLLNAIKYDHISEVRQLIAQGLDVNKLIAFGHDNVTPLYLAIAYNNEEMVRLLIQSGANVNQKVKHASQGYNSSLLHATHNIEILKMLIDAGANINAQNGFGETPLYYKTKQDKLELVKFFINNEADVNIATDKYETPIVRCCYNNNLDIANALIQAGADVNASNRSGETALYWACFRNNLNLVTALLDAGADESVNYDDEHGYTPLSSACSNGNLQIVEKLISVGADIHQEDAIERTSLHHACYGGNLEIVKKLVELGADIHHESKRGTPLDFAKQNRHTDIVNYLTNMTEMWEGWTKSDISHMNDIFSQSIPANNLTKPYNINDPIIKSGEIPETQVESLFSFCPICLQYIKHEAKTCMYMSHDCRKNSAKFYHRKLYEKYSYFKLDAFDRPTNVRTVTWCTLCGRICKNHQHYPLTSYTSPIPALLPPGRPYDTNCAITNGGGGYQEKVWRYRRLREFANELNQLKGQLTKQEAYERLVEAMWDAPLQQKGLMNLAMQTGKSNTRPNVKTYEWSPETEMNEKPVGCLGSTCKKPAKSINWRKTARNKVLQRHKLWQEPEKATWNISANVFPNPTVANAAPPAGLQPYTGQLPIIHTSPPAGWYNFTMIDDTTLIQFRHINADGTLNAHDEPGEHISPDGLVGILNSRLGNPASEEFGKCWLFYTAAQAQGLNNEQKSHLCTANLHPDEVDAALNMADDEHKQVAKNYRTAYTNRFGSTSGGHRRRKVTRKSKFRKTRKNQK